VGLVGHMTLDGMCEGGERIGERGGLRDAAGQYGSSSR